MGNNITELLNKGIDKIRQLISNQEYKNSYIEYKEMQNKLNKVESEEGINYLLRKATSPSNQFIFSTIIGNLKESDKISYLFHLVYEQLLFNSIELETDEDDKNLDNPQKAILNDKQKEREKLVYKISKIIEINDFISSIYYKSYIYELIAEKYYNLANINYSDFIQENKDSLEELQEIIDQYFQCKDNYLKTKNYKKLIDIYTNAYDKVIEHKKILLAFQKYKEKKFEEALEYFNKIKTNDLKILEDKNYGIKLCNEKLGEKEKENKNYEKALEYFTKSKNNFQVFQLKLLIYENKIINCIKEKKYEDSFVYFKEIFTSYNDTMGIVYVDKKYADIFTIFIELMIKLSLFYYEKKNIQKFKKSIEMTIQKINLKETKLQMEELITELNRIESIENKELYKITKETLLSPNISEIKERFYLSLLVQHFFQENTNEICKILLKENINLKYLSIDSFSILKNFLKDICLDCLETLLLISKIFYKIIVSLGKFNKLDCLVIIGDKIKEINKNPNLAKSDKLNDIMENLIYSFQEIMITNKNIKSYEGHKNLLLLVFEHNNRFINCITNGLLFLSKKKLIIKEKFVLKLKDILIKNENSNLLQCLLFQFKLQPLILSDNISIIYDILFFYQKCNNSNDNQKQIFEFLLTLENKILSSKESILFLEKYSKESNIEPTFYDVIEKIPIKFRGIDLSQSLLNYNENKKKRIININKDNSINQLLFKLYYQKEDLPFVEKNLENPKILEKLIYSLKQQKYLFRELNIENITKSYSLSKKELFNLLIENNVHFNEKSLINLLQGFYKDNDFEIKETFNVFNKIKEYQNFSEIININLKIEDFLFKKDYLKYTNFNTQLLEVINNFSFLFGFSSQHQNFVLYILDLPSHANYKMIIDKMVELLIEKNYDIGVNIFKRIIKELDMDKLIELSSQILSNNKIPYNIKNLALKFMYNSLKNVKSKEDKLKIITLFKYFVDKIKIPDILLKYLISYLKREQNENDIINKEIIFILGIYFSLPKPQQDKFLNEIIKIYENNEIYKFIIMHVKSVTKQNHIFYLFSNLYYYNFPLNETNEEKILQFPKKNLINFIKVNFNESLDSKLEQNIAYMEQYFKFESFSPKRDQILRKLFFNGDKNAINNLRLICY